MSQLPPPPFRKLRGYAFDPSLSLNINTVAINQMVYKVPWEDLYESDAEKSKKKNNSEYEPQAKGPVGEYIEVIDYDPTVNKQYRPVDLNDPYILAQDGLDPSESNPLFHQQMVYAVAMTTIDNFENALGRKIFWSSRRLADAVVYEEYVQRLRIYPHAMREANAYYSPQKKAVLFGYFSSIPSDETLHMPDSLVFTALSHDIIAHEVTHAILDGMYPHYNEPTNEDVLAFHEAFADIAALFQHFSFPEVLKHQIAQTRGDLASQNLLGQLAQEFGSAIGNYGSLRDAIGQVDPNDKTWKPTVPDPADYKNTLEPHARGSILVAAVFEAFLTIYKSRIADLLRIASNGTGVLPQGELHPDLVNRLANEAAKTASHVLRMCIRALDYCPPTDITFGDYLRAIITADVDLLSDDNKAYRLAFIDAFRRRGIYPKGIKTLSVESLHFTAAPTFQGETRALLDIIGGFLRDYREAVIYKTDREEIYNINRRYMGGDRENNITGLHRRITIKFSNSSEFETLTGLVFNRNWSKLGIRTVKTYKGNNPGPSFQVANLRVVSRVGPKGKQINQIVFSLIQRCGVIMEDGEFKEHFPPDDKKPLPKGGFILRGGCTLIFDLDTLRLCYAITRPLIDLNTGKGSRRTIDINRITGQYEYQSEQLMAANDFSLYFGTGPDNALNEPFAMLHQH
jgi:hypothetical protein